MWNERGRKKRECSTDKILLMKMSVDCASFHYTKSPPHVTRSTHFTLFIHNQTFNANIILQHRGE